MTDAKRNAPRIPPGNRGVREGSKPAVSIVVASCREVRLVRACLDSICPQAARHRASVVVARSGSAEDLETLRRAYPDVKFVSAEEDSTIPRLRALGMAAATGDIVAVTEDHCVADPNWVAELTSHQRRGTDVIGGSMGNAQQDRAVDWAAYFSEYGFFAANAPNDPDAPLLTGANVAYSRRVLGRVIELAGDGEWEDVVHARLAAAGNSLWFQPTAAINQNQNYRFWAFCRDRYEHGHDYARRRLVDLRTARRWILLVGAAVLPFLLTFRVSQAVGRAHRGPFLRALPITFAFLTAWSVGEAVGYLRGPLTIMEQPG